MLVTPALLQLRSRKLVAQRWPSTGGQVPPPSSVRVEVVAEDRAAAGAAQVAAAASSMSLWEGPFSGRASCAFVLCFAALAFFYTLAGLA